MEIGSGALITMPSGETSGGGVGWKHVRLYIWYWEIHEVG